jgi:hypothetical protein
MKQSKCEEVRRELEELMLADECSAGATQHLGECGDCREFYQQQTKLRQIVGSLGTVEAPPDFDFRLRARLANESHAGGFHLRSMQWSFAGKGFAAAAMMALFVGGVVYVRTVVTPQVDTDTNVAHVPSGPSEPERRPVEQEVVVENGTPAFKFDSAPRRVKSERRTTSRTKSPLVAIDFASERAPVISNFERQAPIFPIDASLDSFRISLDDGEGNARTISMPTITFGSQKVLPKRNQFDQKGVW